MPTYPIQSWNPMIYKNNTYPLPMLYVTGDKKLEHYAEENDFSFLVTITGSNSNYDNKPIVAVMDCSGVFPNCRPNFYEKNKYFTLTLFGTWIGYPPNNGSMLIQGMKGPDKLAVPKPVPFIPPEACHPNDTYETFTPKRSQDELREEYYREGLQDSELTRISFMIFMVFCILLFFSFYDTSSLLGTVS